MLKKILFTCLLFSFSHCQADTLDNALQQLINTQSSKYHITGLSLAVLPPNQQPALTYTAGTQSKTSNKHLSSNMLFQFGSVTKTFTAVLITQRIQNKTLSFNDKLGQFLPQYPKWKNITIEQLIDQTSGIDDYINSPNWWPILSNNKNKVWSAESLVNIAYHNPAKFHPGSAWGYSNTNYVLLGMILEKITGKPLTSLMQNLFNNANLNQTDYIITPYQDPILNKMAHGYYENNAISNDMTTLNGSWLHASGAVVSTPKDITRWATYFYHYPIPFTLRNTKNGKVINAYNELGYSFGAFRTNTPEGLVWFTPGLTSGYTSMMAYIPCLDTYFSYSASRMLGSVKDFHKEMILGILHELNKNQEIIATAHKNKTLPDYCQTLKPSNVFIWPSF